MVGMLTSSIRSALLATALLAGLPWLRSGSAAPGTAGKGTATAPAPEAPAAAVPPDRVVLLAAGDAEYRALAIPRSYKTAPEAPMHLLVFRGGLCIRDLGLADAEKDGEKSTAGTAVVQQTGSTEHGFVAPDGRAAVVVRTRYDSRVDVTPGQTSTANDTVTGDTTLTLFDPAHPDGRWRLKLENARWAKDVLVLPAEKGVVVTTFLPRNGPTDVRILDESGRESLHVPETSAETLRVEASPEGGHVAAEVTFRDNAKLPERGVMVFDLARGTQWTYAWRYGSDDEPVSWRLQSQGVLAVKLPGGTRRFDSTGRKL
jgi:hypothetical protein